MTGCVWVHRKAALEQEQANSREYFKIMSEARQAQDYVTEQVGQAGSSTAMGCHHNRLRLWLTARCPAYHRQVLDTPSACLMEPARLQPTVCAVVACVPLPVHPLLLHPRAGERQAGRRAAHNPAVKVLQLLTLPACPSSPACSWRRRRRWRRSCRTR